ncbi:hypothetical protein Clacol_006065 [Clathrus columnatus]|uniref:HNH nuclease domain-containing protein n=1 Tax=Clathrus columnatus TaxID=1419009 RepID=A0AAV5ADP3_9AGAM|nr:hypothetical protein Clacol_006065 [Clathrus columnatus]
MFQQAQFVYTTPPNQSDASKPENYDRSSDDDYTPAPATSNAVETTPSSRVIKTGTSTSKAAKSRVDIATDSEDLTGSRCLLENTAERNEVEYAHCLRRATSSEILYNLEYSWGMEPRTLNLDTRHNIMRLSSKFHDLFDDGLWLLVPEQEIVDQYFQALPNARSGTRPEGLPEIAVHCNSGPPYEYTIFAHPNMRPVPLFRQKDESVITETHENLNETLTKNDFEFIPHPFMDVVVKSHVDPRFVICNIGWLLSQTTVPRLTPLAADYNAGLGQILDDITTIYISWSTLYDKHRDARVEKALKFRKDEKAEKFRDDNVSHTAPIRVDDSDLPPRRSKRSRTSSQAQGY